MPTAPKAYPGRTGPKTVAGKAKVSRNALRHGLAAKNGEARTADKVAAMAQAVGGPRPVPEVGDAALAFAHAQIDLQRTHAVRRSISERLLPATSTGDASDHASLASTYTKAIAELVALDRYERRARSRRKFAIRAFDEARAMALRRAGK